MSDEEIWAYVRDAHTAVLTTLKLDGSPISLPLWFAAIDRTLYFPTRGKKIGRVRRNPVSSVLVETGEIWRDLKGVHLSGSAHALDADDDLHPAIRAEIARKYDRFRSTPPTAAAPGGGTPAYRSTGAAVLAFRPTGRILNWDNSKLFDD
ncbi:MAG: pyridoxamine 5-phosphate oxidase-related FMN-binding [Jatrophihabitantaceae bacterium]|nr:pyridoxamine 5-phosphate oxidase-related FMN-binding [Jatrophihabitantaceae bacterium]